MQPDSLDRARQLRAIQGVAAAKDANGGTIVQEVGGERVRCFPALGVALGTLGGTRLGSRAVLIFDQAKPTAMGWYMAWDDAWALAMAIIGNAPDDPEPNAPTPNIAAKAPQAVPAHARIQLAGDPWRQLERGLQQALGEIVARLEQCEMAARESQERASHGTVADLVGLLQRLSQTIPADLVQRLERLERVEAAIASSRQDTN